MAETTTVTCRQHNAVEQFDEIVRQARVKLLDRDTCWQASLDKFTAENGDPAGVRITLEIGEVPPLVAAEEADTLLADEQAPHLPPEAAQ